MKNNFDIFRFDFYARETKFARPLDQSSLTTHSQDLKVVINHFKDDYDEVIVVGHSLGSLVILNTDMFNVSKVVLWDPTTPFKNIEDQKAVYDDHLKKYIFHWGIDFLVSIEMVEEWMSLDLELLVKKFSIPCKIVFAGNCNKYDLWKPYLGKFKISHESVVIDDATHGFIEEGTEQKLFEETLKWI